MNAHIVHKVTPRARIRQVLPVLNANTPTNLHVTTIQRVAGKPRIQVPSHIRTSLPDVYAETTYRPTLEKQSRNVRHCAMRIVHV